MTRIFSGMQPTNQLHLGNYLGALKNWVGLQGQDETIFCVVDLHAITVPKDPAVLAQSTREIAAAYIAAGIDTGKSIIFAQSHVSAHAELGWILSCFTPMGWLNRMTQFKEKAGKDREGAPLGLYGYPVLMAADILTYKATHVPVGEDQKQHLELARDIAGAFNRRYGVDFFPLPEPQILGEATRVMSLRDGTKKMSKSDLSDMSRINMTDTPDLIAQKIRKAKTDPEGPLPSTRRGVGRPARGRQPADDLCRADRYFEKGRRDAFRRRPILGPERRTRRSGHRDAGSDRGADERTDGRHRRDRRHPARRRRKGQRHRPADPGRG